ncbi:nucleotide-binding protein [Bacillus sp. LS15-K4]|nr:nucleotide-binding protein [Bacillus sp. LS15-K4]MDJ1476896.1 nucleotide-binding protein [Bacillus sp. LS15-K4]
MYFHVIIEIKGNREPIYELDNTLEDVLEEVVIPYLEKKSFHFDGYSLNYDKIKKINIKRTTKPTTELANFENEKIPVLDVSRESIMSYDQHTEDVTKQFIALGNEKLKEKGGKQLNTTKGKIDKTGVFIVHGHDQLALTKTDLFIRQLGLEPIVIQDQSNRGMTIIEKIESHSSVGFGVILYTPCDVGAKHGDDLQPRARQNVVFEHGFLIGKIGRGNVAALVKDTVEKPNDISGIVYITMDGFDAWKMKLAKELKSSGYEIDMNRI